MTNRSQIKLYLILIVFVCIFMLFSYQRVKADYTGPGYRTLQTGLLWERRYCAINWGPSGDFNLGGTNLLPRYMPISSECPNAHCYDQVVSGAGDHWNYSWKVKWVDSVGGYINYSLKRYAGWIGAIFDNTSEIVECVEGDEFCTSSPVYETFGPAYVEGITDCTDPGDNGWCKGEGILEIYGYETIPEESIIAIETATDTLCESDSCTYEFPEGQTSLAYWAVSSFGDTSYQASSSMSIDRTPPTANIDQESSSSDVRLFGSVSDNGSGLSTAELSLDDGITWETLTLTSGQWERTVDTTVYPAGTSLPIVLRATDVAGNETESYITVEVDSIPPEVTLMADGKSQTVYLYGEVHDVGTGVEYAEISLDGGSTWKDLTLSSSGGWEEYLDSTLYPDYTTIPITVRAFDVVGNEGYSQLSLTVTNAAPTVWVTERWQLPGYGSLEITPGSEPIEIVSITICDTHGRLGCLENTFGASDYPKVIEWNGWFYGELAPTGEYDVQVTAIDMVGRERTANGVIEVYIEPTPEPTEEPFIEEIFEIFEPEKTETPPVIPAIVEKEAKNTFFGGEANFTLAPNVILLGLLGTLGLGSVFDSRNSQWKHLNKTIAEFQENVEKENE